MNHQDWKPIILNSSNDKNNMNTKRENNLITSLHIADPETVKMEAPSNLGQLICQARNTNSKTQKQLASALGIAQSILSRWENNKEIPTNAQIAKIEKTLGIKLPRAKKVIVDEH